MTFLDNQDVEGSSGSSWFLVVEGVILLLSLFRIFVVAIVLAVNIISLRRCMSSKLVKCHCLQLYVSDSVKICNIIYIASWTPFLIYSLLNGRWLLIEEQLFCLIQSYMTNAMLMVLMAMAALLAYSRVNKKTGSMMAAALTLTAWLLPQLSYFCILTTLEEVNSHSTVDFYFLDNLHETVGKGPLGNSFKIGFTICGQMLNELVMTQYILQYTVVILPICLILALIFIRLLLNINNQTYSQLTEDNTNRILDPCICWRGKGSRELAIILGTIVLWMALIRPCILLLWSKDHLFIDLGSHLMLTISAVFVPIIPRPSETPKVDIYRIDLVDNDKNSHHNDNYT